MSQAPKNVTYVFDKDPTAMSNADLIAAIQRATSAINLLNTTINKMIAALDNL